MNNLKAKQFTVTGTIIFLLSFLLLLIGVKGVLGNPISLQNIVAFVILSVLFGSLSGGLYALRMKFAFYFFIVGLIIGFTMMFIQFADGMSGFADLAGLLTMFLMTGIGLISGLIIQLVVFLVRRAK